VVKDPGGRLEPYPGEHLRADPPIEPVRVTTPAAGVRVYDFGVVLSGWVRLTGRLAPGTVVRLVYGEKLDADGRVLVGTPGGAENPALDGRWQIDEYTATGGRQSWQPRFTYKGFQYVEVTGAEVELTAIGVGSDVADTMELRVEHPELQWIADAFRRTAWNGLHGYPDLTPQSMVGWLGATRNAAQPMLYQFGMARLFEHWLDDIRVAQAPSGAIPIVAPFGGPPAPFMFSPVYVSLYPHLVRRHWIAYGDRSVPERHYDAVRRCLEWMLSQLADDLVVEEVFGDWYPPGVELGEHPRGPEGGRLVGSAFVIQAVRDGIALAELLGKAEAATWRTRVARMTARFNAEFLDTRAGIYRTEVTTAGYRQASNAIPLALGLVPAAHVGTVVAHLAADVEAKDRHLDTGSMGTGALPYALSDHGRADLAVAVLGQPSYPGYGALRRMGATTLWESWEPHARGHNDTTIGNPVQWLVERAVGVEPLAPGWARFRLRPRATDSLPGASITLDTVRGRIEAGWRRSGGRLVISVRVPVNAVAELVLPDGRSRELGSGHHRIAIPAG
jgi:alpha-L-rhamnosidase